MDSSPRSRERNRSIGNRSKGRVCPSRAAAEGFPPTAGAIPPSLFVSTCAGWRSQAIQAVVVRNRSSKPVVRYIRWGRPTVVASVLCPACQSVCGRGEFHCSDWTVGAAPLRPTFPSNANERHTVRTFERRTRGRGGIPRGASSAAFSTRWPSEPDLSLSYLPHRCNLRRGRGPRFTLGLHTWHPAHESPSPTDPGNFERISSPSSLFPGRFFQGGSACTCSSQVGVETRTTAKSIFFPPLSPPQPLS